jgi:hypothetical protein
VGDAGFESATSAVCRQDSGTWLFELLNAKTRLDHTRSCRGHKWVPRNEKARTGRAKSLILWAPLRGLISNFLPRAIAAGQGRSQGHSGAWQSLGRCADWVGKPSSVPSARGSVGAWSRRRRWAVGVSGHFREARGGSLFRLSALRGPMPLLTRWARLRFRLLKARCGTRFDDHSDSLVSRFRIGVTPE